MSEIMQSKAIIKLLDRNGSSLNKVYVTQPLTHAYGYKWKSLTT